MKNILIVGSGIAGLTAAIRLAENGERVFLVSPMPSERAQSVMAAGGINASKQRGGDTVESHREDTYKGGRELAGKRTVEGLCAAAPEILRWLENLGVVFNRDENGEPARRPFGGQRYDRTAFSGASTGKQIVTALVQKAREYERTGLIERRLGYHFHSALIESGRCFGALFYAEREDELIPVYADVTVMAVGGQNRLFGKTTGSVLCDGYAAGRLFLQGAALKNPEFIQYHPTTIETPQKRMLITEAARGEGGRLYYEENGRRVYFMEEKYGAKGNLMPRDVVSRCIYDTGRQVYLDLSFLGREKIAERLKEVDELCTRYLGIDVSQESIPVSPSVHFFMGGLAVDGRHRTNLERLYAVGECASLYHGANRLGGNSLLAAVYGGQLAAADILSRSDAAVPAPDFSAYAEACRAELKADRKRTDGVSASRTLAQIERIMRQDMGITRSEARLEKGIAALDGLIAAYPGANGNADASPYQTYRVYPMLVLARGVLTCALSRRESRGAHIREDYPETDERFAKCSLLYYDDGRYTLGYEGEDELCW